MAISNRDSQFQLILFGGGGTPQVYLKTLTFLSLGPIADDDPIGTPILTIGNTTAGSVLSLGGPDTSLVTLNGLQVEVNDDLQGRSQIQFYVTETLVSALNSPRQSPLQTIQVQSESVLSGLLFNYPENSGYLPLIAA
ncbi:MAG: hypothetical protein WC423_16150 [Vulcanimicrobiota bacterium]